MHTSDWHLGKVFYDHSLLEDQKYFLNQLRNELAKASDGGEPYDALIVAGDIYDKAVASSEAVKLFNDFLEDVHGAFPELEMFFSSGNHDSATRLSFASQFLHRQRIHIATDASECDRGIVVGSGDDAAVVYQIPFLQMGSLRLEDGTVLRHQQELLEEACRRIESAHEGKKIPCIVTAHVFAGSSILDGSEKSFVGTAEQIDPKVFRNFSYTALGHIHKSQKAGSDTIRYSGSPLSYNFGEKGEKVLLSVRVASGKTEVTEIAVDPLHAVVRLEGTYDEFLKNDFSQHADDYVELICTDSLVHDNPIENLRSKFPNILSFRVLRKEASGQNMAMEQRRKALEKIQDGDISKIFDLFMADVYRNKSEELSTKAYGEEKKVFVRIAKDVQSQEEA